MIKGFDTSLFDKLFDERPSTAVRRSLSLDELKDSVARDLEALLNTRVVFGEPWATEFPLAGRSVAGFGLVDFAGLCLASVPDRQRICAGIEHAIDVHEPRLQRVRVELAGPARSSTALHFSIHAVLVARPTPEPVAFDALLQPGSLHYAISRRAGRGGRAE